MSTLKGNYLSNRHGIRGKPPILAGEAEPPVIVEATIGRLWFSVRKHKGFYARAASSPKRSLREMKRGEDGVAVKIARRSKPKKRFWEPQE